MFRANYERNCRSNRGELRTYCDGGEEKVTVNGYSGTLVNKDEIDNWRGCIPLNEYPINDDPCPDVIRKRAEVPCVNTTQDVTIRYLDPPTPPPPGDIIVQQERQCIPPAGPPVIIRQPVPPSPQKEALIIREAPPKLPPPIPTQIVTIPAPCVPPPPRKLIVEKPAPAVEKPQDIIIERWLAPKQLPRRVIFDESSRAKFIAHAPIKNEIIEFDSPRVCVNQEFRDLGVHKQDPNEYWAKHGNSLLECHELPEFVRAIRAPPGLTLACDYKPQTPTLIGDDICLLSQVDLDRECLSEYTCQVQRHCACNNDSNASRCFESRRRTYSSSNNATSSSSYFKASITTRTCADY